MSRWIVYESTFDNRYIAREIVGETVHFWELQPYRPDGTKDGMDARRRKKSGIGPHAFFTDGGHATKIAEGLTAAMKAEADRHEAKVKEIRAAFLSSDEAAP